MFLPEYPTSGSKSIFSWKQFAEQIRSRGIVISFIVAISLWLYVSLNGDYNTYVDIPVQLVTNEDQAVESDVPKRATVEIKGRGWDLLTIKYFNNNIRCLINISHYPDNIEKVEVPYTKLAQGINSMEQAQIKSIVPDFIIIKLAKISKKQVNIKSAINIETRQGFQLVGDIEIKPSIAEIKGTAETIEKFHYIHTESRDITDVYKNISGRINLLDTFNQAIKIKPKSVLFSAKIQQECSIALNQIPLQVVGGEISGSNQINPKRVSIVLSGGVEEIANLDINNINLYLEYNDIINDTTGILFPKIDLPPTVKLMKMEPSFIYHFKYQSTTLK